jgi:hypothetical protein
MSGESMFFHNQKHTIRLTFAFLMVCGLQSLYATTETDLKIFLDRKEIQYEAISVRMGESYWKYYAGYKNVDLKQPKNEYSALFSDDSLLTYIDEWFPQRAKLNDDILRRRVEVWHNILLAAQVNYSPDVLKLQSQMEYWVSLPDSGAGKPPLDSLESQMRRLMNLRNQKAKQQGYNTYAELMLDINGLGKNWFFNIMRLMDSLSLKPYQNLIDTFKRRNPSSAFTFKEFRTWIGEYYRNIQTPDIEDTNMIGLVKENLIRIGIDLNKQPFRYDVLALPPGIGGQGIAVSVPDDFRMILNLGMTLDVWMHETGHGLSWIFNRAPSPILKCYEWTFGSSCDAYSEGLAETLGRIVINKEWQKRLYNIQDDSLTVKEKKAKEWFSVYLRYQLYTVMHEVEMYNNPDRPISEVNKELSKKYFLIDEILRRPSTMADVLYISYPVYLQNYLIADIVAWQITSTMEKKIGKDFWFSNQTGPYLIKHFYESGERENWNIKLVKATGRELDVRGYLQAKGLN